MYVYVCVCIYIYISFLRRKNFSVCLVSRRRTVGTEKHEEARRRADVSLGDGDDDDDEDDAGDDGYVRGIVYGACVVHEPSPPTSLTTRLHRPIVSPRHPVIILIRSCVSFVHRVTLVPPGIRSGIRPKKKRGSSLIT